MGSGPSESGRRPGGKQILDGTRIEPPFHLWDPEVSCDHAFALELREYPSCVSSAKSVFEARLEQVEFVPIPASTQRSLELVFERTDLLRPVVHETEKQIGVVAKAVSVMSKFASPVLSSCAQATLKNLSIPSR